MPLQVIDSHTAGEPTRVVVGGVPQLRSETLGEKQRELLASRPGLDRLLVGEPRGSAPLHAVVPTSPDVEGADLALLIFSALGTLEMCGHALIGTVTTLIEEGMLAAQAPTTTLTVQTLAGLIEVRAQVETDQGRTRVGAVSFDNAPSWVLAEDVVVAVPEVGEVRLALVYGGLWYAVVDARSLALEIRLEHVNHLMLTSRRIRAALNERLTELLAGLAVDPATAPAFVPQLLWTVEDGVGRGTNLATSTQLGFDRSPCGTGSSARTALLHSRGLLGIGETFEHRSILGTTFTTEVVSSLTGPDGRTRIVPRVTGSAWVTSHASLSLDPSDPFPTGFFVPPVDSQEAGAIIR